MSEHRRITGMLVLFSALLAVPALLQAADNDDPMRPPDASVYTKNTNTAPVYTLSSIRISPTHRSAIINGKHVGVGDRVGNARVTTIQRNGVTLSIAGRTLTLSLLPVSIKKPAEASRQ